ncbi:MAG: hypothetical protein U5R06_01960 [candidate division KSB1 bacterium]|nr:hypothetical protein [candidate division KSB1 bacterium]
MNRTLIAGFLLFYSLCFATVADGQSLLTWDRVKQDTSDLSKDTPLYYQVYRKSFPGFVPAAENFIGATLDTVFQLTDLDTSRSWYYKVTCTDSWGNRSGYESSVSKLPYITTGVRVFLQGVITGQDSMQTTLSSNQLLPADSPYTDAPRNLDSHPDHIVDWIKIGISGFFKRDTARTAFIFAQIGRPRCGT